MSNFSIAEMTCPCSKFNLVRLDTQQAASPILRGSTLIAMMQSANLRKANNVIAYGG